MADARLKLSPRVTDNYNMSDPPAAASPSDRSEDRQISCSMTSVLLRTVRAIKGETGVGATLAACASPHDAAFLQDTDNWVSLAAAMALLQAGVDVTGDPHLARRVGEQTVHQHAGTQVATLLRSLGSPEAILSSITIAAAKFSTVTEMEAIESGPGRAVVRAVARAGMERAPLHCDWTTGLLSQAPVLFGLPPARVEETECQARGGSQCLYTVSWDEELAAAAADPAQRVTALEAQVVAMSERLESAYATASDLVSPDDLQIVLARIVERAADAVRAPGYVLAVRLEPAGELLVFSDGVATDDARRIASSVADSGEAEPTMLSVTVASSRHDYGRLFALHPAGMQFFDQEKQLLTLYAKHAAAVLDTALALRESARRHEHVSALLMLSQSLARASSSKEVARELTEAVVGVVDCDQATMWLWDESGSCLRREGTAGATSEDPEAAIGRHEMPHLSLMLRDPQPMFFEQPQDDLRLEAMMTDAGLIALAVVPIIAREVFLGLLTVGVRAWPERLRKSRELLEKLTGVAALAAPALQNGRLLDELGRQVVHDGLTGVLNRTGFGRSIEAVLAGDGDGSKRAGLLFVDLDGFKQLNDKHGHQVGDQLLREVAERLRRTLRGDDTVSRLGGDEFAVILRRVTSAAEVHAAAQRVHDVFSAPFRIDRLRVRLQASVGESISPDHGTTIDALVRHADAAMYDAKAQRRASPAPA